MTPKEKAIKEGLEAFDERCKIQPTFVDDKLRVICETYLGIGADIALQEQAKQIFEDIENHYYSDVFSKDQPTLTELKNKWVKE